MKKGFTLIELLAVIVILAIIALIATPIILGIINDAKEDSNKRSIENYAHAVELAVARSATKQGGVIEPGIYTIGSDGKTITSETGKTIEVDYKGETITNGSINVSSDGKIELIGISFDGKKAYNYSEKEGVTSGEIKEEVKEITHLILPDGTLIYYKGKGDVKFSSTLDGTEIKKIEYNAFSKSNAISINYLFFGETCESNSGCNQTNVVFVLDKNIEEDLRNYFENEYENAEIIVPTSSDEILNKYNELNQMDDIEINDISTYYFEVKDGEVVESKVYETEITSVDLSGATSLTYIESEVFGKMQNLKTIILPNSLNYVGQILFECPNIESITVPFKEGELPGYWHSEWNRIYNLGTEVNVIYTR